MKNSRAVVLLALLLTLCFLISLASAQNTPGEPQVSYDVRHDVSPPLRDMVLSASANVSRKREMLEPEHNGTIAVGPPGPDTAVQEEYLPKVSTTQLFSFDGMTSADSGDVAPPDTNGSVGATQFVEIVNFAFAVYDKSGKQIMAPASIDSLWQGFGGLCQNINGGDPVVLWDKLAQRWLVTQLSYSQGFIKDFVCVAVSTS